VLCPEGEIGPRCLPDNLRALLPKKTKHIKIDAALQSVEALMIIDALKRNKYSRLKAARELGIHKSTLFRKIKILGIDLPKIDGRAERRQAT
jgi:transcriptional regulator of acetoin/glycerol metabolism